jgi:general secretion pathway protein L
VRELLYIRLREPSAAAAVAYAVVASDGLGGPPASVFVRQEPLQEVLAQAAGRKLIVFVPGADVRLTEVTLPVRQPAKVLQAVPFVLEEQFAEDVETLHFALGPRQPSGAFPVAVVSLANMEQWLEPFRQARVMPDALVPETLALPWSDGPWAVLWEPELITARCGAYAGFSCVPDDFELFLQLAENGSQHPLQVLIPRGTQHDFTHLQRQLELLPGYSHPLEAMVRNLHLPQSINLMQGRYSQRESLERFWRPWRFAAALLAAAFVLGIVDNGVQALGYKHSAKRQQTANEERFNQLFPSQRVASIALDSQVEQQAQVLRNGGGQGSLLLLIQQAADALAAVPGLTLNALEYRDGGLELDLSGNDLQAVDKLRDWFDSHHGAALKMQSVDSGEGGVKIRAQLTPARIS